MKLLQWERVHGRMADWVAAEPATVADVAHLAPIYSRGVSLDVDLQERLLVESRASMRRIAINLGRVREFGKRMGKARVSLADFAGERFFSGEAPGPLCAPGAMTTGPSATSPAPPTFPAGR